MGVIELPEPKVGPLSRLAPRPIRFVLNWGRRYSLWVFNFGLACCAIEFIATSMSRHDFVRLGVIPFAPGPRQADLMVVAGTVTDKMAPAVKRLYEQMPEPKYVISFGACSNCGGPYWDSYCVTKGVDQIVPVDVYVPGCPPRPEALLHGILRLQEKIATESLAERYAGSGEPVAPAPPPRPRVSAATLRRPLRPRRPAARAGGPVATDPSEAAHLQGSQQPTEELTAVTGDPPIAAPAEPDRTAEPRPVEHTQALPPVEPAGEARPAERTQALPQVEPTEELRAVGRTEELRAVELTDETGAVGRTQALPPVEGPEPQPVDRTEALPAVEGTEELRAVGRTEELRAVESREETGAVGRTQGLPQVEGPEPHPAERTEELRPDESREETGAVGPTQALPPVEGPEPHPAERTEAPVERTEELSSVEDEGASPARGRKRGKPRRRRRREGRRGKSRRRDDDGGHDPSIIPGLGDD